MKIKYFAPLLILGALQMTSCSKNSPNTPDSVILNPTDQDKNGNNSDTQENDNNSQKDNPQSTKIKEIVIDATDYSKFVYFSFEHGLLELSDEQSPTSKSWDLAFHRGDIRTNSGKSTKIKANGGVVETEIKDLEQDIKIPSDDKFVVDDLLPITLMHTDEMGVLKQEYLPVSKVLTTVTRIKRDKDGNPIYGKGGFEVYEILHRGAIIRDFSIMPPKAELSMKVYIIRTPSGKYGKIQITKYASPGAKSGFTGVNARITMKYVYPCEK